MIISGFDKLTLLNYPGILACTIFTNGCNFKCPFCQNSGLVLGDEENRITEEEVLEYLKKRKGIIDGVCITGGEPTLQKDLKDFILKVRALGVKIKLDTNGSKPEVIKELLDDKLLDYVAMDIKNIPQKYGLITGTSGDYEPILQTINLLKQCEIVFEFRTTVVKEFHTLEDLEKICQLVDGAPYFLQQFRDGETVIQSGLHSYSDDELKQITTLLKEKYRNVTLRGL